MKIGAYLLAILLTTGALSAEESLSVDLPNEKVLTVKPIDRDKNEKLTSNISDMEYFNSAVAHMEHKGWRDALEDLSAIREYYPHSQMYNDAIYFQAVCHYQLLEYGVANRQLTEYLNNKYKLKFFEDALKYKLEIANKFKDGAKKHLFDSDKFPKWLPAKEDALAIYDEIISMVPSHDLAAQALYEKGSLLHRMQDYKSSLETLGSVIKKFPKHPLTPDAYLEISEIYYEQSHSEYRNTDLLEMAQIHLKKFIQNFPRDEKVEIAKKYYQDMREIHAKGLYEIGMFYERTHKPKASVIYYVTAIEQFPNSPSADLCKERLQYLDKELDDLQVSKEIIK